MAAAGAGPVRPVRSAKHGREYRGEVELPLMPSAYDAGEDLLGVGAVPGAIVAADLAGDDRGAFGVFGAPSDRVDRQGSPEEGEHGSEFGVEMDGETLGVFERRRVDDATNAGEQSVANRRETVVAQAPVVAAVPQRPAWRTAFHVTWRLRGWSSRRCSQPRSSRAPQHWSNAWSKRR